MIRIGEGKANLAYRTAPLSNSVMPRAMPPLLLPTPTRLEPSRSTWRSVALVPMPSVTEATVRAAVVPVVVVVTVQAARVAEASSARVAEALPPVAVAATSTLRVATRLRLLKHLH